MGHDRNHLSWEAFILPIATFLLIVTGLSWRGLTIILKYCGTNSIDNSKSMGEIIEFEFLQASGFIVTFLALSSITHLVVLAFDRYISVCRPFFATTVHSSARIKYGTLVGAWLYALLWSIFPLFDWSSYALEADGQRCSINWTSPILKDKVYIVCLFIFCYLLPVIFMLFAFISVKCSISSMKRRGTDRFGRESRYVRDTVKAETKHVRLAIIMCGAFILIWTPYAFMSFWAAFFEHSMVIPSQFSTAAAYIAKSSTILNPLLYCFLYKKFRRAFKETKMGKYIFRRKLALLGVSNEEMKTHTAEEKQDDIIETQMWALFIWDSS